jgi:hypothetical protein
MSKVEQAYGIACDAMVKNLDFKDCQEGIKVFLEKKQNKKIKSDEDN